MTILNDNLELFDIVHVDGILLFSHAGVGKNIPRAQCRCQQETTVYVWIARVNLHLVRVSLVNASERRSTMVLASSQIAGVLRALSRTLRARLLK